MKSNSLRSEGAEHWSSFRFLFAPTCENFFSVRRTDAVANFCWLTEDFRAKTETTGSGSRQSGGWVTRASWPSRAARSSQVVGPARPSLSAMRLLSQIRDWVLGRSRMWLVSSWKWDWTYYLLFLYISVRLHLKQIMFFLYFQFNYNGCCLYNLINRKGCMCYVRLDFLRQFKSELVRQLEGLVFEKKIEIIYIYIYIYRERERENLN